MDKFMDSPWFLRMTALALALFLFFSVRADLEKTSRANVGDTADTILDVPVEVYYDNENYVVTGVPETVNMSIKGPSNLVQSTKLMKDFTLKVDLRSLPMGRHTVQIQHENISDKLNVKLDPAAIEVNIEEKVTKSFRVDAEMNDKMLAEDYTLVRMETEPSVIEVTGAKSVVDEISFVKVSVTGEEEISKSFEQKGRVRVLDRDLNKLNVAIEPEEVTVKVEVEAYHKEVPIVVKPTGKPKEGVTVNSLAADEKSVTLYGPRKIIDSVEQVTANLDVSGISGNGKQSVNIAKPKGVTKMSIDKVNVNVDVKVSSEAADNEPDGEAAGDEAALPETESDSSDLAAGTDTESTPEPPAVQKKTRKFTGIPIGLKGLDPQFSGRITKPADGTATLTVTGEAQAVDALTAADVRVTADAGSIASAGEQTIGVSVQVPEGIQYEANLKEVTVMIELA